MTNIYSNNFQGDSVFLLFTVDVDGMKSTMLDF